MRRRLILCLLPILAAAFFAARQFYPENAKFVSGSGGDYIKWVDFNVPYEAMRDAMTIDIASMEEDVKVDWVDLLAYHAAKTGGNFGNYRKEQLTEVAEKLRKGKTMEELTAELKYFPYYREAYGAVLDGFVGHYEVEQPDPDDSEKKQWVQRYGMKVFSPIAKGYGYGHYDDFGNSRSYGYKRKHLGHDLMGNVGTPIIAVESGIVEALGWNQYGGWRIGIRSMDERRYYYYAHLRKNKPYREGLQVGDIVRAGDVIGYLGMTGYSTTENVNNIDTPHLHFGMQLIFDPSQKEGYNEIWIDLYQLTKLLERNRSAVQKGENGEYSRVYQFDEPGIYE